MANRPLYIQLFHLHGLFRGENLELGRDADTGGQTKYVLELARALAAEERVGRVDVFTRRIEDPRVSADYAQPLEHLGRKLCIVRIRCGGPRYRRKELLWPHLDEFVDNCLRFMRARDLVPDVMHAHYADAGYVGCQLAPLFGVPLVFTGHSLGRAKLQHLQAAGMSEAEANRRYAILRRIAVEEQVLQRADLVVTSTRQEQRDQYGLYASGLERSAVIPPGIDTRVFRPFSNSPRDARSIGVRRHLEGELARFHMLRAKPLVLALSRPDRRKNIPALVHAYGSDRALRQAANLAIFAGLRKDISAMPDNEREVLSEMLLLMDRYDLYGSMAIPKRHDSEQDVPELYRLAARSRGVFVNPALTEPFGLTLIEAAASGLPVVSTRDGGPQEILEKCGHGELVDPNDPEAIAAAIKAVIGDPQRWATLSANGIRGVEAHYTWRAHVRGYLDELGRFALARPLHVVRGASPDLAIGARLYQVKQLLITDIDDTLIGDAEALARLVALLERRRDRLGFGVATGRSIDSARAVLAEHGVPTPDVIVASVGAELYFGDARIPDRGWEAHIAHRWQRADLASRLAKVKGLTLQEETTQRPFKLSYYVDPARFRRPALDAALQGARSRFTLIHSGDGAYLDLLPYRASKGQAVRYLAYKWDFEPGAILVAGDSDNDREMLSGRMPAVVVANHRAELADLRRPRQTRIYFSTQAYAAGILDGLRHFDFVPDAELRPGPF